MYRIRCRCKSAFLCRRLSSDGSGTTTVRNPSKPRYLNIIFARLKLERLAEVRTIVDCLAGRETKFQRLPENHCLRTLTLIFPADSRQRDPRHRTA
jgi:hypothetical protein